MEGLVCNGHVQNNIWDIALHVLSFPYTRRFYPAKYVMTYAVEW